MRLDDGMSVQMTIRVDDELAAFVDQAARAGEGSRAEVLVTVARSPAVRGLRGDVMVGQHNGLVHESVVDLEDR